MLDIFCAVCAKKESHHTIFICCAKCKIQHYCSRECLETNWANHKKICSVNDDSSSVSSSNLPLKGLSASIHSPIRKLLNRTWLHDRGKEDVYKLLIDAYRLYRDDRSTITRESDPNNIYGEVPNSRDDFRRFLSLAESRPGVLPSWWTPHTATECLSSGFCEDWSSLAVRVNDSEIIEHYGDSTFLLQLKGLSK